MTSHTVPVPEGDKCPRNTWPTTLAVSDEEAEYLHAALKVSVELDIEDLGVMFTGEPPAEPSIEWLERLHALTEQSLSLLRGLEAGRLTVPDQHTYEALQDATDDLEHADTNYADPPTDWEIRGGVVLRSVINRLGVETRPTEPELV